MKITVEEYLCPWLEGKIEREEIDENTEVSYRHHIEVHLILQLGRIRLRDLRSRHLTEAYARIVKQREEEIAKAQAKRHERIGARLFEDDQAARSWKLVDTSTTESGAPCLLYDRIREHR